MTRLDGSNPIQLTHTLDAQSGSTIIPPAEAEERYYAMLDHTRMAA